MKRWSAVAMAGLTLAALAACGNPSGTDGDLLDDWPAMAAAGVPVPDVGACYNGTGSANTVLVTNLKEVEDCSKEHVSETIHVGAITGDAKDDSAPPDGADLEPFYTECNDKAKDFLGADWHDGRLLLRIFLPSAREWEADARFFRCDLIEIGNDTGKMNGRTSSLKDGLKGDKPVEYKCMTITRTASGAISDFIPAECTEPHNGEYAGTFNAPKQPYPTDANARRDLIQPACRTMVSQFTGMTEAQYGANAALSFAWSTAAQRRWDHGDRNVRCFVTLTEPNRTSKSLRNNGTGPIN